MIRDDAVDGGKEELPQSGSIFIDDCRRTNRHQEKSLNKIIKRFKNLSFETFRASRREGRGARRKTVIRELSQGRFHRGFVRKSNKPITNRRNHLMVK